MRQKRRILSPESSDMLVQHLQEEIIWYQTLNANLNKELEAASAKLVLTKAQLVLARSG